MNLSTLGLRNLVTTTVNLLNQPIVKEGVKNVAGSLTFAFGLVEIYDVYQIARGREISTETQVSSSKWVNIAHKVIILCAKIALILSAGVSRPGVFIISSMTGLVFSTSQLDRFFGPNTIFAINPWHPRHVVSIAAVILASPAIAQSTYQGLRWIYSKVCLLKSESINNVQVKNWLTDSKIKLMNLFNTITSRPVLHIGNQLGSYIVRFG